MNGEHKTEYEEINLMDYIKVLFKRKRLILVVFLVVVIGVGVYSFFVAQKVYKINTILEAPEVNQLVEKVKEDTYGIAIREKLGISEENYPRIKAEGLAGSNLVVLKIETVQPQQAKNILKEINNFIVAESQERVRLQKESIQNDITMTNSAIPLIEKDIEITKSDIIRAEEEIKRAENKISYTEEEKKNLEAKIEVLEKGVVNEQTMSPYFALFLLDAKEKFTEKKQELENLYLRINSLKREKENLGAKIKSLERDIENSNIRINFLKSSLEEVKPIRVVKTPFIFKSPIKPKPLLNILIAAVLGIFLGVFLAFSKEWWGKAKGGL